jgi:hypothetical protein
MTMRLIQHRILKPRQLVELNPINEVDSLNVDGRSRVWGLINQSPINVYLESDERSRV